MASEALLLALRLVSKKQRLVILHATERQDLQVAFFKHKMGRRSKSRQQKLRDENSFLNKIGAVFDNLPNPAGMFFETNEPWRLSQGRWLPRGKSHCIMGHHWDVTFSNYWL